MTEPARDYEHSPTSALLDLIEDAYQQGALRIDETWEPRIWGALRELTRRAGVEATQGGDGEDPGTTGDI